MSITGSVEGDAQKVGVGLVDVPVAKDTIARVSAAFLTRERTSAGRLLELNLLSRPQGVLANQGQAVLGAGVIPRMRGYADTRILVACGINEQLARFIQISGRPELARDTRFATNAQRVSNQVLLVPGLELPRRTRTAGAWHPLFAAGGVPSGIIGTIADALPLATELGLDPTIDVHDAWATCWVRRFITPSSGHRRSPATTFRRPRSASTVRTVWSGFTLEWPSARARGARQRLGHRGRRQ